MSRDFPDWVDPEKAASARREFSGRVPVGRLPRLEGMVVEGAPGEIAFSLRFSHDDQGQVCVDVEIDGQVAMTCQRSLETYDQAIAGRSRVGVVVNESDEAGLPEDYEVRICPDQRLELLDLVAEEVLLALPLVPTDPASEPVGQPDVGRDTHRPFEALAALTGVGKNKKKD